MFYRTYRNIQSVYDGCHDACTTISFPNPRQRLDSLTAKPREKASNAVPLDKFSNGVIAGQFPVTREQVKVVPEFRRSKPGSSHSPALMRVLFDNGTPRGVAAALTEHIVEEARSHGWDILGNGELLDAAEAVGFDVFVTTTTTSYISRIYGRKIAIVVLDKARWKLIRRKLPEIAAAVASAKQGSFVLIEIPTD